MQWLVKTRSDGLPTQGYASNIGSNTLACTPSCIWQHLEDCVNFWKVPLSVSWYSKHIYGQINQNFWGSSLFLFHLPLSQLLKVYFHIKFVFSKSCGSVDWCYLAHDGNCEHGTTISHYILRKKSSLCWNFFCVSDFVRLNKVNPYKTAIKSFYVTWNGSDNVQFLVMSEHKCITVVPLQNCMYLQSGELGSWSGMCATSTEVGNEVISVKLEGITDLTEEENLEPMTSSLMKTDTVHPLWVGTEFK